LKASTTEQLRRAHHRVERRAQLRIGKLLLEERHLRLLAGEHRFCLRDVLLTWSDQRKLKRLAVDGHLGIGNIRLRLGIIDFLPAHRPASGIAGDGLEPLIVVTGLAGVGLRQHEIGACLGNLLRPAAMMQPVDDGALCGCLRLGLRQLRHHAARIELRQDLTFGSATRTMGDDSLLHAEPRLPDETARWRNFLSLDTNPSS
jgi:hypothetical protein